MSEKFTAGWLALREPADHRARALDSMPPLQAWWTATQGSSVLDLGCGTGSNLRYLAPRLPGSQQWTLLDHDAELLSHARAPRRDVAVRTQRGDLSAEGLAEVAGAHLVTASALLDLTSEAWLAALVDACAASGCAALFALTYDGAIEWTPRDPLDDAVRDAVNAHQRRDKGLGTALGPAAVGAAEGIFRRRGYGTRLSPSPWRLDAGDAPLARALVDGWAAAATEQQPAQADDFLAWAARRRARVARGDFQLVVGHQDLLALPPLGGRPDAAAQADAP